MIPGGRKKNLKQAAPSPIPSHSPRLQMLKHMKQKRRNSPAG